MGIVYEALDQDRNERVALKTIRQASAESLLRLKREFRSLQGIHHPNLVALGELFSEGSQCFFTMELVEGSELLAWVRGTALRGVHAFADTLPGPASTRSGMLPPPRASEGPPPMAPDEARVRGAFRQLALGLSALHDAGKVHRDVKPPNVRVTAEGRVVLLDFGLVLDSVKGNSVTGLAAGTPAYMAPEQASSAMVGPPADWYAVGVALYECLTGKLPYDGAPLAVLMAKQGGEPPRPRALVPDVPADLDELCASLLRFAPSSRPDGASVLRRLAVHQVTGPTSRPTTSAPSHAPFVGRELELRENRARVRRRRGRQDNHRRASRGVRRWKELHCPAVPRGGHGEARRRARSRGALLRARGGPVQGSRRRRRCGRAHVGAPVEARAGGPDPHGRRVAGAGLPSALPRPGDRPARPGADGARPARAPPSGLRVAARSLHASGRSAATHPGDRRSPLERRRQPRHARARATRP